MIKLQVNLKNTQTEILFDQQILTIYSEQPATLSPFDGLLLHTNQQQITQIDYLGREITTIPNGPFLTLTDADWPEGLPYLGCLLAEQSSAIKTTDLPAKVPSNYRQTLRPLFETLNLILERFGFNWQRRRPQKQNRPLKHGTVGQKPSAPCHLPLQRDKQPEQPFGKNETKCISKRAQR
ncbi:hypothetical protein QY890_06105 [Latilactobacillus sakei]